MRQITCPLLAGKPKTRSLSQERTSSILLQTLYTALEGAFYYLYCPKGSEKNGARTEPAAPTSKEGLHSEWLAALENKRLVYSKLSFTTRRVFIPPLSIQVWELRAGLQPARQWRRP